MKHIADRVTLNNGVGMPWLGLGVFKMTASSEAENAVRWALEAGYRAIDTAAVYGNEEEVGRGISNSDVSREEIFLTTKVWNSDLRRDRVREAFETSLRLLKTEYIDLYLVHWPVEGRCKAAWEVLQELHSQGRVRAIGVSNFMVDHLEDLLGTADIVPAVNQIEYHPRLVQPELMDFCSRKGIRVEAWSPLMQGGVFGIPEIADIAGKHGKTVAQVVLRWNLQNGIVTIPKSSRRDRILENADLFDFELDSDDMERMASLNTGRRVGPDPHDFDF